MHRLTLLATLAAGLLIGCVAARVIVPPARAGTSPQRWEYHCEFNGALASLAQLQASANKAGAEGWELVGAFGANGAGSCFKRPVP